jgi:hypothetical protein
LALAAEALVALARARLALPGTSPEDVLQRNAAVARRVALHDPSANGVPAESGCADVSFIIPRLAFRLPWRADCLVQALAGQQMLLRRGIASEISVGTTKHSDGSFEAHAWLTHEAQIILGGDISRFEPLLDSRTPPGRH